MADVVSGRWTHAHTGDLAVFLIGMRINRLRRPDAWVPVLAAMGPMLAELSEDPESGFLGYRLLVGWRGPTVVQYWRSTEDVYRYANDRDARHRPAWTAFFKRARKAPGVVGVWHETYQVAAAETIYVDVPRMGLAAATGAQEVTGRLDHARTRLAGPASTRPVATGRLAPASSPTGRLRSPRPVPVAPGEPTNQELLDAEREGVGVIYPDSSR